jgi:hypothetical protein
MTTKKKAKKFDCVEMKRKIQKKLMTEYEAQKDDFASYGDFIRSKAKQSPLWKKFKSTPKKTTRHRLTGTA